MLVHECNYTRIQAASDIGLGAGYSGPAASYTRSTQALQQAVQAQFLQAARQAQTLLLHVYYGTTFPPQMLVPQLTSCLYTASWKWPHLCPRLSPEEVKGQQPVPKIRATVQKAAFGAISLVDVWVKDNDHPSLIQGLGSHPYLVVDQSEAAALTCHRVVPCTMGHILKKSIICLQSANLARWTLLVASIKQSKH